MLKNCNMFIEHDYYQRIHPIANADRATVTAATINAARATVTAATINAARATVTAATINAARLQLLQLQLMQL